MSSSDSPLRCLEPVGAWRGNGAPAVFDGDDLRDAVARFRDVVHVVREPSAGKVGVAFGGEVSAAASSGTLPLLGSLPALYPEWLGDRSFAEAHGVRFALVAGEMANGIATTRMVVAMAKAGMLGFFGAAGLGHERVEEAVRELSVELGDRAPWGVNLIHSPQEPALEEKVAELLLRHDVRLISASAFMTLTPAVVRCAVSGLRVDPSGRIVRPRRLFAKVSRQEVARRFLSPPPSDIVRSLVERGFVTQAEASLAERIPVAEDLTAEADSGGHTDNQPLVALLPAMLALRDEIAAKEGYLEPIRVGAAGGLGTPGAVVAAFALGAAYVVTGSINQAAIESGLSDEGKRMLAKADLADVMMAPAADMFELGVKVQVLSRGCLFGVRAAKLYEAFVAHPSLEAMPAAERARLERDVLGASVDAIWSETRAFWRHRDPAQLTRAESDAKHRMALVFRWYLGKASRWAIDGEPTRRLDYQIWCGPAMGAFNRWVSGTFLENPEHRSVVQISLNLLEGAAALTRAHQLRSYGAPVPASAFHFSPRRLG